MQAILQWTWPGCARRRPRALGATAIAKAFGIGRASVYRVPEAVYVQVETRAGSAAWA